MKKIISLATILTVAAMVAGPAAVQAATAEELQAQINTLLAQLSTLQSQLSTMTGTTTGTVPAACAGISTFTTNLTVGSTGSDVKCLQALLNQSADTQVASSGAGSPGNETTYFGSLTQAAVANYQAKHGITPTAGYFGPLTRSSMNSMLVGTTTPTTPTTPTTVPSTCTSATEGSYAVVISASPVSRTINAGSGIEAYGIDIKATNSDIKIGKLDLQASVVNATTAVAENPGNFIQAIKIYDTSVSSANLIKTYSLPVFSQDTSAVWYTQMTDMNFVVPKDTVKKLLLVIDTGTSIDQNRTVTLRVYGTSGLRGRDCAGIDSYTTLTATRVLTVQQPGVATLTISTATDNPNSDNIEADANNGVQTKETLLSLNAKATAGSTSLVRLEVTYASAGSAMVLPSILYLYDGDTLVSSATPNATENGAATFENFVYAIAQDETKNLKVKADWSAATTFESGGAAATIVAPASTAATAAGGVHQRANGQQVGVVTSAAITSNPMFIAESGLHLTFVSGVASYAPNGTTAGVGTATGTIVFTAKPFGGTLQEPAYASSGTSAAAAIVSSGALVRIEAQLLASGGMELYTSGTQIVVSRDLQLSPASQDVAEGSTATITAKMTVDTAAGPGALAGNLRFKLEDICYDVGSTLRCQGSGAGQGGATTGNLTDSWITNTTYLVP